MHSNGTWATMSFLMILCLVNQFNQPSCNFWYLTLYCWPSIVLELGHHYILVSLKKWNTLMECTTITDYKWNRNAWRCTISYSCCNLVLTLYIIRHTAANFNYVFYDNYALYILERSPSLSVHQGITWCNQQAQTVDNMGQYCVCAHSIVLRITI
jgi:hypothetical protein